jgi:hypothetical protein
LDRKSCGYSCVLAAVSGPVRLVPARDGPGLTEVLRLTVDQQQARRTDTTMASASLLIAEQCIDRQARPYLFRGRQIESVTGRVLLHAIDSAGRPLCGVGREHLTPTGQPWQATDAAADGRPGQARSPKADAPHHPAETHRLHGLE